MKISEFLCPFKKMPYHSQCRRRAYFKNVDRDLGKRNLIQLASWCPQGVSQILNLIRNLPTVNSGNAPHCKPLSNSETVAIVIYLEGSSVKGARGALAECPIGHYTRGVSDSVVDLKGYPIVCYTGDSCTSTLRILRAASTTTLF